MQCFISTNRDIYFNLALEEYLLMHQEHDFFILWQSEPAVVVGKHQNTLAEINYRYIIENGIHVARRLSGGGTVYHDQGNLNFTYIANGETGKMVDFRRFIGPVIDFLGTLGLKAEQGMKNEILTSGKKISGNAEHVFKNRVLHHGTLLFHTDLNLLRECLRVVPGRYKDRAVQSNRSSVINISECLSDGMDMASFEKALMGFMLTRFEGELVEPGEPELNAVSGLASSKYRSWEWVFGWSPDYELRSAFQIQNIDCQILVKVHRGIIKECFLESQQIPGEDLGRLIRLLKDCRHEADQIIRVLKEWDYLAIRQEHIIQEMAYSFF